jgi:hypothetical protein
MSSMQLGAALAVARTDQRDSSVLVASVSVAEPEALTADDERSGWLGPKTLAPDEEQGPGSQA